MLWKAVEKVQSFATVKHFKTTAGAATLLVWIFGFLIRSWKGLQSVENTLRGLQVIKREHFCEHTV